MSEAQERLRQYLEQRREMGESEFVLDTLSVEDALKVLGGRAPVAGAAAPVSRAASSAAPNAAPGVRRDEGPRDSAARRAADEAAKSGDWRDALRNVDAGQSAPSAPAPAITPARALSHAVPSAPVAAGLVGSEGVAPRVIGANAAPSGLAHLESLADVAAAIASCSACTLAAGAKHHVPGEGDPNAKFVIVGEAPGATEDELGKPFVGKSGDLLTKILEAINLKRDEVFICNVLKHRPPGNRNPTSEEIVACRPFLLRQLELLQPRVILALGTFAAQTLLETDSPIGKLRGIEHRYHGIPLVATYHPAALLRNPNWKRPAWEDVQLARRILDRA